MSEELKHHGVKGMKWGVRKAERVAARKQKNAGKINAYANKLRNQQKERQAFNKVISSENRKQEKILSSGNTRKAERYLDRTSRQVATYNTGTLQNRQNTALQISNYRRSGRTYMAKLALRSTQGEGITEAKASAYRASGEKFVKSLNEKGYDVTGVSVPQLVYYGDSYRVGMVGKHTVTPKSSD